MIMTIVIMTLVIITMVIMTLVIKMIVIVMILIMTKVKKNDRNNNVMVTRTIVTLLMRPSFQANQ